MDFAKKVKKKLAQLLEVSFSTVNRWEQGKSLPSYAAMQKFGALCKEKNITFDE